MCEENRLRNPGEPACKFAFEDLGACKDYPYGFVNQGEEANINPCIFLKLNKIIDWKPTPILPESLENEKFNDMTDELKEIIKNAEDPNQIWFDCKGRFAADKEILDMTFFPNTQGIPIKYFPFQGGRYEPPLVAVRINVNEDE